MKVPGAGFCHTHLGICLSQHLQLVVSGLACITAREPLDIVRMRGWGRMSKPPNHRSHPLTIWARGGGGGGGLPSRLKEDGSCYFWGYIHAPFEGGTPPRVDWGRWWPTRWLGLVWVVACAGGGSPRPVCPSLTGTTGAYPGGLVSQPPGLLTPPNPHQGAGGGRWVGGEEGGFRERWAACGGVPNRPLLSGGGGWG